MGRFGNTPHVRSVPRDAISAHVLQNRRADGPARGHRGRLGVLAAAAVAVLAGSAVGEGPHAGGMDETAIVSPISDGSLVIRSVDNAALLYHRYWASWDHAQVRGFMDTFELSNPEWSPNEAVSAWLREHISMPGLLRATRIERADFGLERELGLEVVLTHLGPMRSTARLLIADARRLEREGDMRGVTDRIAAAVRLSQHVNGGDSALLIEPLVGAAILSLACFEVERLSAGDSLTPEAHAMLVEAFAGVDKHDPVGIRAAMAQEGRSVIREVDRLIDHAAAHPGSTPFDALLSGAGAGERVAAKLREMDTKSLREDARRLATFYETLAEVIQAEELVERAMALDELAAAGGFGLFAQALAPSLTQVAGSIERVEATIASARAALADAQPRPGSAPRVR